MCLHSTHSLAREHFAKMVCRRQTVGSKLAIAPQTLSGGSAPCNPAVIEANYFNPDHSACQTAEYFGV